MSPIIKKVFSSSFWGMLSTIFAGIIQLIMVPLLINSYGKENYGLIVLALSILGYVRMLDFGMNTGCIRFGAIWKSKKNIKKKNSLFQLNIIFSGLMGIFNMIILIWIGSNDLNFFGLNYEQEV